MQTRRTARGAVRDRIDAAANGGGVAFFAHVGGFIFGLLVTWLVTGRDKSYPRS